MDSLIADETLILSLEHILTEAAELGLEWAARRPELVLDEKSAGQFASNADVEIERLIRSRIKDQFGDPPIIGEELGGKLPGEMTGWAIDPIDGTSNFARGLPLWGISAGYLENGESMLGAIALPEFGLMLSARRGHGVRVNGASTARIRRTASVPIFALGENDFETGPDTDQLAQVLRNDGYSVVRYRCAVFALLNAALGRLDGYIENGCGLWDVAAAWVICEEAGLNVQVQNVAEGRYRISARW